jgi:hypothetical protein
MATLVPIYPQLICPFFWLLNGHIGCTLSVPIYPQPICPFKNGHIGLTLSVFELKTEPDNKTDISTTDVSILNHKNGIGSTLSGEIWM